MKIKKRSKKTRLQSVTEPPQVRMDAAGIDISPEEIYVAVGPRVAEPAVRRFGTMTRELNRIADWLQFCGREDGGNGVDRGVLDSFVSSIGGARVDSVSGQCTPLP